MCGYYLKLQLPGLDIHAGYGPVTHGPHHSLPLLITDQGQHRLFTALEVTCWPCLSQVPQFDRAVVIPGRTGKFVYREETEDGRLVGVFYVVLDGRVLCVEDCQGLVFADGVEDGAVFVVAHCPTRLLVVG